MKESEYISASACRFVRRKWRAALSKTAQASNQFRRNRCCGKAGSNEYKRNFLLSAAARSDFAAFDRLMRRKGGEPPGPDDTIA